MYEFDYVEALKVATPDQIAKHLSKNTGFDYDGARKAGASPEQINSHLFKSGQVLKFQPKPEWWGDFDPDEQDKIQQSMVQYNRANPEKKISYDDIPNRSGFFGVVKEFGSGLKSGVANKLPEQFLRFARNAFSEYDPNDNGALTRGINEQVADEQAIIPSAQRMVEKPWQKGAYEGASNIPTSLASMAPGIVIGAANPTAGVATSMGVTGGVFYGGARDQFLNDVGNAFESEHGRKPTDQEWKAIYNQVEGAAAASGLWEAGTEAADAAFSQILFTSPVGKQIGKMFAKAPGKKGALSRFVGKTFLDYGAEVAGETVAEKKQSDLQRDVGLSPQGKTYGEAFKDVAIPTAFATGPQAGGLQLTSYLNSKLQGKPNGKADGRDIKPEDALKEGPEADLADAKNNDDLDRVIAGEDISDSPVKPRDIVPTKEDWKQWESEIQKQKGSAEFQKGLSDNANIESDFTSDPVFAQQVDEAESAVKTFKEARDVKAREEAQQKIERMFAPGVPFNEGLAELEANIAEFRRVRSQEALEKHQQDAGKNTADGYRFRKGLEDAPADETPETAYVENLIRRFKDTDDLRFKQEIQRQIDSLYSPGTPFNEGLEKLESDIAEFKATRREEAVKNFLDQQNKDKGNRPFSNLQNQMSKGIPAEVVGTQNQYDDGIDLGEAEFESESVQNQRAFQQALTDNFGRQDIGGDDLRGLKPTFEQEGPKQPDTKPLPGKVDDGTRGGADIEGEHAETEQTILTGRDEKWGVDVELKKDKDGYTITETEDTGRVGKKMVSSGAGGIYLGNDILNMDGEFVPFSQIRVNETKSSTAENTAFKPDAKTKQTVVDLIAKIEFARAKGDMDLVETLENNLMDIINGKTPKPTNQATTEQGADVSNQKQPTPKPPVTQENVTEREHLKPGIKGRKSKTYLNDNTPIEFVYEVMDADDLTTSHDDNMNINPDFPSELQPRERSRKASQMQVETMANKLNPERLGSSSSVAQGAPIIGDDSNTVESGNGRVLAIRKAYTGETGKAYKKWVNDNAMDFGITDQAIENIKKPVLVRRRITKIDDLASFTQKANEADTAKLSSTEQAIVDANNLTSDDLSTFHPSQDGDLTAASNKIFIGRFLGKMTPEEQSGYLTEDGRANKQLADRIQATIFQRAYGSKELLTLVAEEADPDIKNILNGLMIAAAEFAKARGLDEKLAGMDIINHLVNGILYLRQAQKDYPNLKASKGTKAQAQVNQAIAQQNVFGDKTSDEAKQIASFIAKNTRSGKRLGEFFFNIGSGLRESISDLNQMDIFGIKNKLSSIVLINKAISKIEDKYEDKQQDLFSGRDEQISEKTANKPDPESSGKTGQSSRDTGRTDSKTAESTEKTEVTATGVSEPKKEFSDENPKKAIQQGKIKSHPDYPELTQKNVTQNKPQDTSKIKATEEPEQKIEKPVNGTKITAEDGRAYILEDLAKTIYKAGMSLKEFTFKMAGKLGNAYHKVEDAVIKLYHAMNAHLDKVTLGSNVGAIDLSKPQTPAAENTIRIPKAGPEQQTTEDLEYEEVEDSFYQKAMDLVTGTIKYRKDKGTGSKKDISVLAHTFKTTMYNASQIGGAAKRTFDIFRKQSDYKFEKLNELLFEGDLSLQNVLENLKKVSKEGYQELNKYFVENDRNATGHIVKENDGSFELFDWRKKNGKLIKLGTFETEDSAWEASREYEAEKSGLSEQGKDALKAARIITRNLYKHYAKDMKVAIESYKKAGMPLPEITVVRDGKDVQINLEMLSKELGDRQGYYFPRLRQSGQYRVFGEKNGRKEHKYFDSKILAGAYRQSLERKGYETKFDHIGKLSEDIYQSLDNLLGMQQTINTTLREMGNKDKQRVLEDRNIFTEWRGNDLVLKGAGIDPALEEVLKPLGGVYRDRMLKRSYRPEIIFENVDPKKVEALEDNITKTVLYSGHMFQDMDVAFAEAFARQFDAVLKSRGSRARMISRGDAQGDAVSRGYEEDLLTALIQTSNSAAGGYAKGRVAQEASATIMGRDIPWEEYRKENDKGVIDNLKEKLQELRLETPQSAEEKKILQNKLRKLRGGLMKKTFASLNEVETVQAEITDIQKKISKITKWTDPQKAKEIQMQINVARTGLYEKYQKMVKDRSIQEDKQGRIYKELTATLKDILRNDEAADRIIGTLKGITVWQYLGFRVSSAAVNMTNMVTGVPAVMNGETDNKVSLTKALRFVGVGMKEYGLSRLKKSKYQDLYDEIHMKGFDEPKLNREAFSVLQTKLGRGWSKALETSMYMFGVTERMNRAATIAGTYLAMKDVNKGKWDHDAMLLKAREISDFAHGVYEKSSRPYHMRGDNIGARTLQMAYVFSTFSHNYIMEMQRLGMDKKQAKAALYMAFSPAIFGLGATIPMGIAKAIAGVFGGDDPEETLIQMAEDNFGGGNFARYGITGMGDHGISLKGSLTTRFGTPDSIMDIFGAPGSVVGDIWEGGKNITKGYYQEGFEKILPAAAGNVLKGFRESTEGVTTKSGLPVYFGNEQMKGDSIDTILRVLSFNPTHISKKKEIQWNEYKVMEKYRAKKADLNKRLRRLYSKPPGERDRSDFIELNADMRDFNIEVRDKGISRFVSPITGKSKRAVIRAMRRPKKQERLRRN